MALFLKTTIKCLVFFTVFLWYNEISNAQKNDTRLQYHYVCPKKFENVGRKCYHFSNHTATWFQSYFSCNDFSGSNLTVFTERYDQKQLEYYLYRNRSKNRVHHLNSFWVGGFKDWKKKKWIYPDGSLMQFPTLRDIHFSESDNWTCLLIDGNKKRWSAENCMERRPFICEAPAEASVLLKVVNELPKRKVTIDDCINSHYSLTKRQQQRCLRLLEGNSKKRNRQSPSDPAAVIQPAKPGFTSPSITVERAVTHICPQNWMSIGNQCYLFSIEKATWTEAHFTCSQINAKLAVVKSRVQDQKLRIFLNGFTEKQERWLGARYNIKTKEWIWALNGKPLKYNGFLKETVDNSSSVLDWQAVVMDPQYAYRWTHRNQMERHLYICQVKGKAVKRLTSKRPSAMVEIISNKNYHPIKKNKYRNNRRRSSRYNRTYK